MRYQNIFRTVERETTSVPVKDLYIDGFLNVYEEVQSSGYFNFSLRGNRLSLTAGNYVGLIPLNDDIAIFVEPKIAKSNWLHLVERVNGTLKKIDRIRDYKITDHIETPLLEFLIDAFVSQLFALEREGLLAQYIPRNEKTSFPRGRINFKNSIRDAWSRGYLTSISVDYYLFSKNTPHNRLIKYAIHLSMIYASSLPQQPREVLEALDNFNCLFSQVPLDNSRRYIPHIVDDLQSNSLPSFRKYYNAILRTALLIVENTGIDPHISEGTFTLSFVVNMEEIFERYCQIVLKENALLLGDEIVVKNQEEGRIPLFGRTGLDKRKAEPDIVISHQSSESKLILEVKYKSNPSRQDINQAVTYAVAYRTNLATLICFSDEYHSAGWEHLGQVGEQVDLWIYRISLDEEDMDNNEFRFVEDIGELFTRGAVGGT